MAAETNFAILSHAFIEDGAVIVVIKAYYKTNFSERIYEILSEDVLLLEQLQWRVVARPKQFVNVIPKVVLNLPSSVCLKRQKVVRVTTTSFYYLQCFLPDPELIGETAPRRPLLSHIIQTIQENIGQCTEIKECATSYVSLAKVHWYAEAEHLFENGPIIFNTLEFRIVI
jgi:hypothetical protein